MLKYVLHTLPITGEITAMNDKLSDLSNKADENARKITDLANEIASYKEEVRKLRNELSDAMNQISGNREDVIAEINNRYKRLKNILFFNIPENFDVNNPTSDFYTMKNILSVFNKDELKLSTNLDNLVARRIGNIVPNKIRPLCVTFNSRDDVLKIISNYKLLPNYSFKTDKTDIQRQYLKTLTDEKNKHNSLNPNDPLVIKYRNEVPMLAKK